MSKIRFKPGNMLYPVPAVMVSCRRPGEKPNIVTVAWAGTICSNPPMLSISLHDTRYSYDIITETGEFVVNLVSEPLAPACDWCGVKSGRDVDKFKAMNLTPIYLEESGEGADVSAPAISESPVNLYCKVTSQQKLGSHDIFMAEIKAVTVDDSLLDETGRFHLEDAHLIAYSHGTYYALGKALGTFGFSVKKNK